MTAEIADPRALADVIRERMDGKIAQYLPDEVFDRMLEAAVHDLTKPQGYSGHPHPSKMQAMITSLIEDKIRSEIHEILQGDEWRGEYFNGYNPSEAVKAVVEENAGEIFKSVIMATVGHAVQTAISNQIQNQY